MKVVLFCGGLGTRIRDYSDNIPKPMVPTGNHPILWHVMQYYSQYGHHDFVLCLGYKANVVKNYFLNYKIAESSDCVISGFGSKVEIIGEKPPDWHITLVDTGIWRNIGERLFAVKHFVDTEEIFLANYSDGLCDVPLDEMIARFKASNKIGCFLALHPPINFHLAANLMRTEPLIAYDRVNNPMFGSMEAISSFAGRFSIMLRTAKSSCLSHSTV